MKLELRRHGGYSIPSSSCMNQSMVIVVCNKATFDELLLMMTEAVNGMQPKSRVTVDEIKKFAEKVLYIVDPKWILDSISDMELSSPADSQYLKFYQ